MGGTTLNESGEGDACHTSDLRNRGTTRKRNEEGGKRVSNAREKGSQRNKKYGKKPEIMARDSKFRNGKCNKCRNGRANVICILLSR